VISPATGVVGYNFVKSRKTRDKIKYKFRGIKPLIVSQRIFNGNTDLSVEGNIKKGIVKRSSVTRTSSPARNFSSLNEALLVRMITLPSTAARVGWLVGRPVAARVGSVVWPKHKRKLEILIKLCRVPVIPLKQGDPILCLYLPGTGYNPSLVLIVHWKHSRMCAPRQQRFLRKSLNTFAWA
jgi:hypothetical protein